LAREPGLGRRGRRPTGVVLWGLGAMGRLMARLVLADPGLRLVGAVSRRGASGGSVNLAGLTGIEQAQDIPVYSCIDHLMKAGPAVGPEVVLHATTSFVKEAAGEIEACLEHGLHVITIAEEMAWPWAAAPEEAVRLDSIARAAGRAVLGTGVNPGFVLDTLIVLLTAPMARVDSVHARRVNDLSPFGPAVMRTQGVGLSPGEFAEGVKKGTVVGHIGFPESMHLIARAIGVELTRVEQEREPIISKVKRQTPHVVVEPGYVAGCRHSARGWSGDRLVVELEHPQQVRPEAEGVRTGDFIRLEGLPRLECRIEPEIPGGLGTAAVAVNAVTFVASRGPTGIITMLDLQLPHGTALRDPAVLES